MNCIEKDEVNRWNANRLVDEFEALWKKYEDSEREFEKKIEKFR